MRGGSRHLLSPAHNRIPSPHHCVSPSVSLGCHQSCSGDQDDHDHDKDDDKDDDHDYDCDDGDDDDAKNDEQEYERAVIFRLGRLLSGGARGPGVEIIVNIILVLVAVVITIIAVIMVIVVIMVITSIMITIHKPSGVFFIIPL